jgi:hypothetical protein
MHERANCQCSPSRVQRTAAVLDDRFSFEAAEAVAPEGAALPDRAVACDTKREGRCMT